MKPSMRYVVTFVVADENLEQARETARRLLGPFAEFMVTPQLAGASERLRPVARPIGSDEYRDLLADEAAAEAAAEEAAGIAPAGAPACSSCVAVLKHPDESCPNPDCERSDNYVVRDEAGARVRGPGGRFP